MLLFVAWSILIVALYAPDGGKRKQSIKKGVSANSSKGSAASFADEERNSGTEGRFFLADAAALNGGEDNGFRTRQRKFRRQ